MKKFAVLGLVALALGIAAYGVNAQEGKKMSIKDVMKKFPALAKKINKGEGSDAEKKEFVELAKALAANTPKKGDADKWKERTATIVAEAEKGEKQACATNCKGCHDLHKDK